MKARITLVYKDSREAKAISESVSPDNIKTPKNLSVKTANKGRCVETIIRYDGENLMTFQSTIDDLLSCISIAEKALASCEEESSSRERSSHKEEKKITFYSP